MNLSKGGAQGVHSALQFAEDVIKDTLTDNRTDEARGGLVKAVLESMNKTIQHQIQIDQPPGDPTKLE